MAKFEVAVQRTTDIAHDLSHRTLYRRAVEAAIRGMPIVSVDATGAASFYLAATKDKTGAALNGAKNYRLHVPPNVPAKQFWAVTVYDLEPL